MEEVIFRLDVFDRVPGAYVSYQRVIPVRRALLAPGAAVLEEGGLGTVSLQWEHQMLGSRKWSCTVCGEPAVMEGRPILRRVVVGTDTEADEPVTVLLAWDFPRCGALECFQELQMNLEVNRGRLPGRDRWEKLPPAPAARVEIATVVLRFIARDAGGELTATEESIAVKAERGLFNFPSDKDPAGKLGAVERTQHILDAQAESWILLHMSCRTFACLTCGKGGLKIGVNCKHLRLARFDPPRSTYIIDVWVACTDPTCVQANEKLMIRHMRDVEGLGKPRAICRRCEKSSTTGPGSGSTKRCSRCKAAFYCSAQCQKADWPSHKPNCRPEEQLG
ncbi:hypothetical protein DFJ74DRAFT_763686 [Hyaloraphidium curvatum]|nr:hypothetical protein DFJ74DRAFT_763686 [Hyaloraphidium curvatum]